MRNNIPKITDGELNILEVIWEKNPITASEIVTILKEKINWNRNTTYTFINRLVDKGVVKRDEPGFICTPLYSKEDIRVAETKTFLEKMYEGSLKTLLASFLSKENLSDDELKEIKDLIDRTDK